MPLTYIRTVSEFIVVAICCQLFNPIALLPVVVGMVEHPPFNEILPLLVSKTDICVQLALTAPYDRAELMSLNGLG